MSARTKNYEYLEEQDPILRC